MTQYGASASLSCAGGVGRRFGASPSRSWRGGGPDGVAAPLPCACGVGRCGGVFPSRWRRRRGCVSPSTSLPRACGVGRRGCASPLRWRRGTARWLLSLPLAARRQPGAAAATTGRLRLPAARPTAQRVLSLALAGWRRPRCRGYVAPSWMSRPRVSLALAALDGAAALCPWAGGIEWRGCACLSRDDGLGQCSGASPSRWRRGSGASLVKICVPTHTEEPKLARCLVFS